MATLNWTPQPSYRDFFQTDAESILRNRTVFRSDMCYLVAYGGRGGAKTWTFADAVVVEGSLRSIRILITREIQLSIDESIKAEIERVIVERGLSHFYTVTKTSIVGRNGTRFIFKGLQNHTVNSIKSIAAVDVALVEEAHAVSKKSWEVFLPSIRPPSGRPPVVIVLLNPDDDLDDTYQRFVVKEMPKKFAKLVNWRDNVFFPDHLNELRLNDKRLLPDDQYQRIWEGVPTGSDEASIIRREWVRAARFASRRKGFAHVSSRSSLFPRLASGIRVTFDPSGQGRNYNAVTVADGNIVKHIERWLKSRDLKEASRKAFDFAVEWNANVFTWDACGGYGDGVAPFINDYIDEINRERKGRFSIALHPYDAGDTVMLADKKILRDGAKSDKTYGEIYANLKAQTHGLSEQVLYSTYRFAALGHDVNPEHLISIDVEDDDIFNVLVRELSLPMWVRSEVNSKKLVESKKSIETRTGEASPDVADAFHMLNAPFKHKTGVLDAFYD